MTDAATQAPATKQAPGVTKRSSAYFIDPRTITRREGWNPRIDFGEIEALAASIKANSMLNPIRVKRVAPFVKDDGKGPTGAQVFHFELIDGDRRLTAVELILKKDPEAFPEGIPAIIVDKAQDDLTGLIQMFEANSGKQFTPMEEAAAYDRMRTAGMTIKQICQATGRKQVHVVEVLNLVKADAEVQQAVETGKIGKTQAKRIATIAKGDATKQKELTEQAAKANASGSKTERRKLNQQMDETHRAVAAKKGKTLKIRALSDLELSEMGAKVAEHLVKLLQDAKIDPEQVNVVEMIGKDDKLAMAYTMGVLEALKAAAGVKATNLFL